MNVTLPNGTIVEGVPDGTSKADVMAMAIKNGMATEQEFADSYEPEIAKEVSVPKDQPMPYGMKHSSLGTRNRAIRANNTYENSLVGDPKAQQYKEEAQNRNPLESVLQGVKEVATQMYAGTLQSPDWMPESIQDILDTNIGGENKPRVEQAADIEEYMADHEKAYKADRMESPIATTVGELLPYLATGQIGEKALLNSASRIAGPLQRGSIKANRMLGNADEASRIAKRFKPKKDALSQNLGVATRGTATGAAEGAAEYDQTAGTGALSAMVGGGMGMISPLKILDKVPNEGGVAHKTMIDELHREGFQITPGLRTKNRALQTEESALRNSDTTTQLAYNKVDEPNLKRLTEMTGEAMGLSAKGDSMFSQADLKNHLDSLSENYKRLEDSTTGIISPKNQSEWGSILKSTQPTTTRNTSAAAVERHKVLKDIFGEMRKSMGKDGSFDGKSYQTVSRKLKQAIDSTYDQGGDKVLQKHLQKISKGLDSSMEKGMGKANAKEWKDLHERYSMTNLVMENGLDAQGKVNPNKMASKLMSKPEARRTLTGQGGRVKKLQDVARFSTFLNDVEGGSLTGLGRADAPVSERGAIKRGVDYVATPLTTAKANYKLNTFETPFVGKKLSPAHGIDPNATVKLGRAMGQASPIGDSIKDAPSSIKELLENLGL